MNRSVIVLLADGFEEIEAATPIDVLRRAGAEVVVAGLGSLDIHGAHGLSYLADIEIEEAAADYELVVLPGGMPGAKHLGESRAARTLVEKAIHSGDKIAAICAAPVMTLGAWGFLNGKTATCYPGMESMFPDNVKFVPERVVTDGIFTTSRGPGTAMEFALSLAAQLMGAEVAEKVAFDMLVN